MMSEFGGDSRLVVGKVTGIRQFRLTEDGKLRGPLYDSIYEPGENVAVCRTRSDDTYGGWFQPPRKHNAYSAWSHKLSGTGCTCGFYAYYDPEVENTYSGDIEGIIEGWGTVTSGSAGFRAEKCEVVAVIMPGYVAPGTRVPRSWTHPAWFDRLAEKTWKDDNPIGVGFSVVGIVGSAMMGGPMTAAASGIWAWLVALLFVMAFIAGVVVYFATGHQISRRHPMVCELEKCYDKGIGSKAKNLADNYPNVKIYSTREEAFANHPLQGVNQ